MKNKRHIAILELIRDFPIDTQEELQQKLCERGFNVTQATISRDIRELNVIKSADETGTYKYRINSLREDAKIADKFASILHHAIRTVKSAQNLVVIKTYTGMGNAVGAAIDSMDLETSVGTIAGDDTVLIITADNDSAEACCAAMARYIQKDE